jgi:hypothetical protein
MKSPKHVATAPSSSATAAAPPLFASVAPLDNQPVISHGASRKNQKSELESKLQQQTCAMKVLQAKKEVVTKKAHVLG